MINEKLLLEFQKHSRTDKQKLIERYLHLASGSAIAKYVEAYLFDILDEMGDDEYIANYLREKGFEVISPEGKKG